MGFHLVAADHALRDDGEPVQRDLVDGAGRVLADGLDEDQLVALGDAVRLLRGGGLRASSGETR